METVLKMGGTNKKLRVLYSVIFVLILVILESTLEKLIEASQQSIKSNNSDLVIWPESAIPFHRLQYKRDRENIRTNKRWCSTTKICYRLFCW